MGTLNKNEVKAETPAGFDIEAFKKELLESLRAAAAKDAAKIIDDAKAQAQAIITNASTAPVSVSPKLTARQAAQRAEAYLNEMVEIKLFYDEDKYKDDVFVSVNNKTYIIKRGEYVKVPRCVAVQLEANHKQELDAIRTANKYVEEHRKAAAAFNIN